VNSLPDAANGECCDSPIGVRVQHSGELSNSIRASRAKAKRAQLNVSIFARNSNAILLIERGFSASLNLILKAIYSTRNGKQTKISNK
jgi:hypothetical protein